MTVTPVLHGTFSVHKFSVLRSRQLWPPNYSDYHFSARSENIFLRIKLADIYLLWLKVHDGFLDASHGRGAVVKCAVLSCLPLCAKSWMIARQAAPSVELFRQECWSGLPCPSPGDLPEPEVEIASLTSLALAGKFITTSANIEKIILYRFKCYFIDI